MKKNIYTLMRFFLIQCLGFCFLCFRGTHAGSLYNDIWVESTLQSLTLREKIGQLFIVAAKSATIQEGSGVNSVESNPYNADAIRQLIVDYGVGGVIFLGKTTTDAVTRSVSSFQELSKVPLLITLDAEWGLGMRLKDAMSFSRNDMLGKMDDDVVRCVAQEIGRQLALIGVHMNFAPVVDVNNNPNNPIIGTRSFGDEPQLVAQKGIAFMYGLQDAGIIACAKHFPGHGDTAVDSHIDLPLILHDRDRLNNIELYPFVELIKGGVLAIMIAHLEMPALESGHHVPTSLSYSVVTNLLKNELNFKGLVITDALEMKGVSNYYEPGYIELQAFLAGNDILLCPLDVPGAIDLIEQAIRDGRVAEQELDMRVRKILLAKAWTLTRHPLSTNPIYNYEQLHTPEAYVLQQQLCNRDR